MNSFLACATIAQSPTHAIVTAESLAVLAGLLFAFFAYARHQAAARDPSKRPIPTQALMVALGGWLALCLVIPFAVHALNGSGWPTWAICAPAPILQCIGWFAALLVGVAWLASREVFAHLRERRAAGQPAFAATVPMSQPYPLRDVMADLRRQRQISQRQASAVWARPGVMGRFLDSQ